MKAKIEFEISSKKIIKDLPDTIDPIILIEQKVHECPFCKTNKFIRGIRWCDKMTKKADKHGKTHNILTFLNKYQWEKHEDVHCTKCGCTWDTDWFPVDRDMFKVEIDDNEEKIS